MEDLGIYSGLPTLENSFFKLEEYKSFVRRVYGTGVCHVPEPVVWNKISLSIGTYLLIGTGIGYVDSLHFYIITYVVIFDVFHIDVIESR